MRVLEEKDIVLMEKLMLFHQAETQKFLAHIMKKYYKKKDLTITKDYILAKGTIPIALAAHMDTVWETSNGHQVFYDQRKNIMVNLRGGGFDDKAGIFMILKILESGLRPHVIFCADEEIGSKGADVLIEKIPKHPFEDCRFIIQLDRRGTKDCVFYDCDNEKFVDYVEQFGFEEAYGSFTDICTLCPAWGMAGVNLSIGYDREHTADEVLYVGVMLDNLDKVITILTQEVDSIPYFEFIPAMSSFRYGWYPKYGWRNYTDYGEISINPDGDFFPKEEDGWFFEGDGPKVCKCCGKPIKDEDDGLAVILNDLHDGYYCWDCATDKVDFCELCGEAFELDPKDPDRKICPDCYTEIMSGKWM